MLEKTKGEIKNGQSRENQRGNQEWTIQRKPKGKSRMDNPEKTKGEIKNGQSRDIPEKTKGEIWILATLGIRHRMKTNKTKNTTKKTDTIEKPWVNLGTGKGKAVLVSYQTPDLFSRSFRGGGGILPNSFWHIGIRRLENIGLLIYYGIMT